MKIEVIEFYPEEFRRKIDQEKYQAKGTCEVRLEFDRIDLEIKNITYRIDHEGKVLIKPPFRVYSNKNKGQKPKLVPSIKFGDPEIWTKVEELIKSKVLENINLYEQDDDQLDFFDEKKLLAIPKKENL